MECKQGMVWSKEEEGVPCSLSEKRRFRSEALRGLSAELAGAKAKVGAMHNKGAREETMSSGAVVGTLAVGCPTRYIKRKLRCNDGTWSVWMRAGYVEQSLSKALARA